MMNIQYEGWPELRDAAAAAADSYSLDRLKGTRRRFTCVPGATSEKASFIHLATLSARPHTHRHKEEKHRVFVRVNEMGAHKL